MDLHTVLTEIATWPVEDRIRLVHEVWDQIAEQGHDPELSEETKAELDRRIEAMDRDPNAGVPWEEVKACVLGRLRK